MSGVPTCPRCGRPVSGPSPPSTAWHCHWHGEVFPLYTAYSVAGDGLGELLLDAAVPVWLPWPLPAGWLVTGFAGAGDRDTGVRACVVALAGPNPIGGGLGDMLLISEEPGIGLGARLAGITGPDPGEGFAAGLPHALVRFGKHEFPLWHVAAPQRAAFAGEVLGNWLWIVLWPDTAGVLLVEALPLRDLRDPGQDLDLPFGPRSPRLPG
jgi:hypothetical protein